MNRLARIGCWFGWPIGCLGLAETMFFVGRSVGLYPPRTVLYTGVQAAGLAVFAWALAVLFWHDLPDQLTQDVRNLFENFRRSLRP